MRRSQKLLIVLVLVMLLLTIPATVLARKNVWKARLSFANELHEVVGSTAVGSIVFVTNPDGSLAFQMQVRGLSGPASGAHIHGPADASTNAPVVLTLCGSPAPAAVATCTTDADGTMYVEGVIDSGLVAAWGLPGRDLFEWMNTGMAYVNAHTALNPAGEARGQINPQ
jgi:hypothetical protein